MKTLMLAKSKAGHDKNHIYVVVGEDADCVMLANGKTKSCAAPKRKKKIHIQPIKELPSNVRELMQTEGLDDEVVIKILDLDNRRKENV